MVSNSNNVKTLCPFHPPLRLKAGPRMVPLPLLAGLQATPLHTHTHTHTHKLLKILDTLNNPFSPNRNVLFLWCSLAMSDCILFPQPRLRELGMMSPVWSVGSSTSQLQTVTLHFTTSDIKRSFFCVHSKLDPFVWEHVTMCHTLRLLLDRGWLRLLNRHGSEGVSTGSLWRSGVIPSVPGSWNMPMEIGRSFLDT